MHVVDACGKYPTHQISPLEGLDTSQEQGLPELLRGEHWQTSEGFLLDPLMKDFKHVIPVSWLVPSNSAANLNLLG